MHELAVERRDVVAPQRLHREHVLAGDVAALLHVDAVVLDLVRVPTEPDTEHEPAARLTIEGRDRLGRDDRIALRDQADPGADDEPFGHRGRHRQRDERVERALVLLARARRRRSAAGVRRLVGMCVCSGT